MRQRDQLAAFITAKRHSRAKRHSTLEVGASASQHFTPERHGLTGAGARYRQRLTQAGQPCAAATRDSRAETLSPCVPVCRDFVCH